MYKKPYIASKFQKLIKDRPMDKYYYVRGTFTRDNLDFSKDLKTYKDLGFSLTSIEPVVGSEDNKYAIREEDIPTILEEYEKIGKKICHSGNKWNNKLGGFYDCICGIGNQVCKDKYKI